MVTVWGPLEEGLGQVSVVLLGWATGVTVAEAQEEVGREGAVEFASATGQTVVALCTTTVVREAGQLWTEAPHVVIV